MAVLVPAIDGLIAATTIVHYLVGHPRRKDAARNGVQQVSKKRSRLWEEQRLFGGRMQNFRLCALRPGPVTSRPCVGRNQYAAVKAARAVGYDGAVRIDVIADGSEGLRADRIWLWG